MHLHQVWLFALRESEQNSSREKIDPVPLRPGSVVWITGNSFERPTRKIRNQNSMRNRSPTKIRAGRRASDRSFQNANGNARENDSLKTGFSLSPSELDHSRRLEEPLARIRLCGRSPALSHVGPADHSALHGEKKVPMNTYVLFVGALSLFLSSAAIAQHGGTEQERQACADNVHRYCRPVLDQGDLAVLACLQQHRETLTATCRKVLVDHGQ
jgi:hypothetical protein